MNGLTSTAMTPRARACPERLRLLLERGLPLTERPWRALAEQCGMSENEVLIWVARWQREGLIKRLGLVVRHHALGMRANAMVVWDLPDATVAAVGRRLAAEPAVTLCYRRRRCPPAWPYNLFCMIHGARRERVLEVLDGIVERHGLQDIPHRVLFSLKAYKQCGGRYTQEKSL